MSRRRRTLDDEVSASIREYYMGFTDAALRQTFAHVMGQSAVGIDQKSMIDRLVKLSRDEMLGSSGAGAVN